MSDISYSEVMNVTMSWDKMKSIEGFQERAGFLIYQRVFELEPKARSLFHFTEDEDLMANPQFALHARTMVDMIDMAVGFLGPDLDPLAEDLVELGKRHINYGVPSEYLPVMERSVIYALEELLGDKLTRDVRLSWEAIFHFMITHMVQGMK
jgi:hemoglobin-like flavoprotein